MYAGRGSDKNRSYMNAQQCFHLRGSGMRDVIFNSIPDRFFPRPASGRRESRPATAYMETALYVIHGESGEFQIRGEFHISYSITFKICYTFLHFIFRESYLYWSSG